MLSKYQYGRQAEVLAVKHLKRNGYKILTRNYRTKVGEIDIIAKDRETIVFVEVKARRSEHFGGPKFALTSRKQERISKAALWYLKETNQFNEKARFDVVAIRHEADRPAIEIIKNAFDLAYK